MPPLFPRVLIFSLIFSQFPSGAVCFASLGSECPGDYYQGGFTSSCNHIAEALAQEGITVNPHSVKRHKEGLLCSSHWMRCAFMVSNKSGQELWLGMTERFGFGAVCDGRVAYSFRSTELPRTPEASCNLTLEDGLPRCCMRAGVCVLNITAFLSVTAEGLLVLTLRRSGSLVPFPLSELSTLTPFWADQLPSCILQVGSAAVTGSSWIVFVAILVVVVCLAATIGLGVCLFLRVRRKRRWIVQQQHVHHRRSSNPTASGASAREGVTLECLVYPAPGDSAENSTVMRIQVVPPELYTGAQRQVVQGIPAGFAELPVVSSSSSDFRTNGVVTGVVH